MTKLGRRPTFPEGTMKKYSFRATDAVYAKLIKLGKGVLSDGVRQAVDMSDRLAAYTKK